MKVITNLPKVILALAVICTSQPVCTSTPAPVNAKIYQHIPPLKEQPVLFQTENQQLSLSIAPCPFGLCKKQFDTAPIDLDELYDTHYVLKITITNNGPTRYLVNNRTIGLPITRFEDYAKEMHTDTWWNLAYAETALQAGDLLLWPSLLYCLDLSYISQASRLKKGFMTIATLLAFGALKAAKDRYVSTIREKTNKSANAHREITKHITHTEPLRAHQLLEPQSTLTKFIMIKKEAYHPSFTISIPSHDYTATPHTIDFNVHLSVDQLNAL